MKTEINALGQLIGFSVPNWTPPPSPPRSVMQGRLCRLEPLDIATHAHALHEVNLLDKEGRNWTYLPYGPFDDFDSYHAWLSKASSGNDPLFYVIVDQVSNRIAGLAAYLRIDPMNGSIEVGHLNFSPLLQRQPAATEAMFLMMQTAFTLGYRRYEWKCNALNEPSRSAALRLGLSYEGIFRQAGVPKGHNRDTTGFAAIDSEWPELKSAFTRWLAPENFDAQGQQKVSLSALTAPILKKSS